MGGSLVLFYEVFMTCIGRRLCIIRGVVILVLCSEGFRVFVERFWLCWVLVYSFV